MTSNFSNHSSPWKHFFGPNLGYIEELYERYKQDPNSVDPEMRDWFEQHGPPSTAHADQLKGQARPCIFQEDRGCPISMEYSYIRAFGLVRSIR